MKKLIGIILSICLAVSACLSLSAFAAQSEPYQYEYEDLGVTIVFDNTTAFTDDERQYLADILAYGDIASDGATTYSWCWLTGHDYQYDSVMAIEHKVNASVPRCREIIYKVETCSKCDHMEITVLNTTYIDCCPED